MIKKDSTVLDVSETKEDKVNEQGSSRSKEVGTNKATENFVEIQRAKATKAAKAAQAAWAKKQRRKKINKNKNKKAVENKKQNLQNNVENSHISIRYTSVSIATILDGLQTLREKVPGNCIYGVIIYVCSEGPQFEGYTYTLANKLFIRKEAVSVDKAIDIVNQRFDAFINRYFTLGAEILVIEAKVEFRDQEYAKLHNDLSRDKIIKSLFEIQDRINNMGRNIINTLAPEDIKSILNSLNDISKAVSKGLEINTPLYLHTNLYHFKDPAIKILEFSQQGLLGTSDYVTSYSINITKGDQSVVLIDHHFKDNIIKRHYKEDIYTFNGKFIQDFSLNYQFKRLKKVKRKDKLNVNIGVIDIETALNADKMILPYACGFIVQDESKIFYGQDCINQLIKYISENYSNHTFYCHNLEFDGPFLLKALVDSHGNPEKIKVFKKVGSDFVGIVSNKITFLDRFKILPNRLASLAKSFKTEDRKGIFPYKFVDINDLNFVGQKPDLHYYDNISVDEYQIIPQEFDLQKETLYYLEKDLRILFQVITQFQKIIFEHFKMDITKSITLPGLSFRLYLKNFYKEEYNLKHLNNQVGNNIRRSHTGGLTIINKRVVENAFYYDMNRQYPSVMTNVIPVGNPSLITKVDPDTIFGFFYVTILPRGHFNQSITQKDEKGKIYFPISRIDGWFFSEEIKEIIKKGWLVQIKFGYQFEKGHDIFKEFVETLHGFRIKYNAEGNQAVSLVIKLIINSLYGRIGYNTITTQRIVIKTSDFSKYFSLYIVFDSMKLNDEHILITFDEKIKKGFVDMPEKVTLDITIPGFKHFFKLDTRQTPNSSFAAASAIARYARIRMIPFKTDPENPFFYSDTDSLVVGKKLDEKFVSDTQIGKFSKPLFIDKGYFLAKKFYAMKLHDGTIIKKAAGLNRSQLTFEIYAQLAEDQSVTVINTKFINFTSTLEKKYHEYFQTLHFPTSKIIQGPKTPDVNKNFDIDSDDNDNDEDK